MASAGKPALDDSRRGTGSPKIKGRENAKDTLCRNITIYGRCRYEDKGCAFNHDPHKVNSSNQSDSSKKRFNVDSPSFTPSLLSSNGSSPTSTPATTKKMTTISPKAANAAPFQPRSVVSRSNASTPGLRQDTVTPDWTVAEVQEFVPQGFDNSHLVSRAFLCSSHKNKIIFTTCLSAPTHISFPCLFSFLFTSILAHLVISKEQKAFVDLPP